MHLHIPMADQLKMLLFNALSLCLFVSLIGYSHAIICKCDSCLPENSTCVTDNLCFVSYERNKKIHAYGCKDGQNKFQCTHKSKPHLIVHCCNESLCNDKPLDRLPDEGSPMHTQMFVYLATLWKSMNIMERILLFITLIVIIISLSILFLALYMRKQHKSDNYKKNFEFSLTSSDLLLESGQSSKQLIDSSSGSGSGLPTLVQVSISRQIQLLELIGKGRFGQVWRGMLRGNDVAVKIFLSREERSWLREVEIYQTDLLRHNNILGFIAADNYDNGVGTQLWLITDYHEKGSLYDYLSNNILSVSELIKMAYSIAAGLSHLHIDIVGNRQKKPAIAHKDLSKNILVRNDGECVIADLGLAVKLIDDKLDIPVNHREGTKRYLAPEVLAETLNVDQFDSFRRADMYAFGLVIWELATRTNFATGLACDPYRLPYEGMVESDPSIEEMREVVVYKKLRPPQSPSWETDEKMKIFNKLMTECWYEDPAARLTALRVFKTLKEELNKTIAN